MYKKANSNLRGRETPSVVTTPFGKVSQHFILDKAWDLRRQGEEQRLLLSGKEKAVSDMQGDSDTASKLHPTNDKILVTPRCNIAASDKIGNAVHVNTDWKFFGN